MNRYFRDIVSNKNHLLIVLAIIVTANIAILVNIPFLRQVFGFLLLSILPGSLILLTLKVNRIGFTEKFVLSVGLSVSFVLVIGLVMNSLEPVLVTPLATMPLLLSFDIAIVVLLIVAYARNKGINLKIPRLGLSTSEKAFLVIPAFFVLLSILGTYIMNTRDNNIILMLLLFLIFAYVVFICFLNHRVPSRIYPGIIFLISISLLLMYSLRSNHIIIGADTGREYYLFAETLSNQYWSALGEGPLGSALSISLFPAIYHSLLGGSEEYLFKILYSLIFSVSPLVIYIISKKYVGTLYAFLASLFFISQPLFLATPGYARSNTAIFFFALAFMVIFHTSIGAFAKRLLFLVFVATMIVSHYSVSFVSLFVFVGTWVCAAILLRLISKKRVGRVLPEEPITEVPIARRGFDLEIAVSELSSTKKNLSIFSILLYSMFLFIWYGILTGPAFESAVQFLRMVIANLGQFFSFELRGSSAQAILGGDIINSGIPQLIFFLSTWMSFLFIAIGIFSVAVRYYKIVFRRNKPESGSSRINFDVEYFAVGLVCSLLLLAVVVVPFVSQGYGVTRLYIQTAVVLSPFFIVGGVITYTFLRSVFLRATHRYTGLVLHSSDQHDKYNAGPRRIKWHFSIVLLVLIPYFMCSTGVMYQLFGVPQAITLNSQGSSYESGYIHDQESYASKWLSVNASQEKKIHTDTYGIEVLTTQGLISPSRISFYLGSDYQTQEEIDGYIYLRYANVINEKMIVAFSYARNPEVHSMEDYPELLIGSSKIYSSGGSEVFLSGK